MAHSTIKRRLNIKLSEQDHKAFKLYAAHVDKPMQQIVVDAIRVLVGRGRK